MKLPQIGNIKLYAIINQDGEWYRIGGQWPKVCWTDDFSKARVYNKIGPARTKISFFANNYKKFSPPTLVELTIGTIKTINEEERLKKAAEVYKKKILKRKENYRKYILREIENGRVDGKDWWQNQLKKLDNGELKGYEF